MNQIRPAAEVSKPCVVAFHVPPDLMAAIKAAAAQEGISKSDVARRALIRDLREREVA